MRIGLISDTHGFLDPRVHELFAGVDHIFHAGDIGRESIITELRKIAPVTAVIGNTDGGLPFKQTEIVRLPVGVFVLHHIVLPYSPVEPVAGIIERERPAAVIFGHTHHAFAEVIGRVLFVNPGYSGKEKFDTERRVAIMRCDDGRIKTEFIPL